MSKLKAGDYITWSEDINEVVGRYIGGDCALVQSLLFGMKDISDVAMVPETAKRLATWKVEALQADGWLQTASIKAV